MKLSSRLLIPQDCCPHLSLPLIVSQGEPGWGRVESQMSASYKVTRNPTGQSLILGLGLQSCNNVMFRCLLAWSILVQECIGACHIALHST